MAILNFRQLEIFRAVMLAKTVSGAAQLLDSSQPGLSRMLKYMEDRVGFPLFDRVRGRLMPTGEAIQLFKETQFLFDKIDDLDHVLRRLASGEDRIFRIGASPSLASAVMPACLRQLRRHFPKITIEFDTLSVDQVPGYLFLDRGEYALTLFPVDHPNVQTEKIAAGRIVCIAHAESRIASMERVRLADLAAEPLLSFRSASPHGIVLAGMFAKAGVELKVAMYIRYAETAVACVSEGLGVALVDEFSALVRPANVAVVQLAETGNIPVYLNRSVTAARSSISETLEKVVPMVIKERIAASRRRPDPFDNVTT